VVGIGVSVAPETELSLPFDGLDATVVEPCSLDEAIALNNGVPQGLSSSIFTTCHAPSRGVKIGSHKNDFDSHAASAHDN